MFPISFRLALMAGCLIGPWLIAGPPLPCRDGLDDYCPKPCTPVGPWFRPAGCDGYEKKCLAPPPGVCLSGIDPYCKKPMPLVGPRCLPAQGPVDGCCPPGWFGLRNRP